jgi:hypothetical protein
MTLENCGRWPKYICCLFIGFLCTFKGQAQSVSPISRPDIGVFILESGANTALPGFPDYTVGFTAGAYIQPSSLIGLEVRASSYAISARFPQSPMTVGIRVAPSFRDYALIGYLGGGISRSRDIGSSGREVLPPQWIPAWQASAGIDRKFSQVSWRIVDISYIRATTAKHSLRTGSVGTGIVLRFSTR